MIDKTGKSSVTWLASVFRLEAVASRLEAIAIGLEAIKGFLASNAMLQKASAFQSLIGRGFGRASGRSHIFGRSHMAPSVGSVRCVYHGRSAKDIHSKQTFTAESQALLLSIDG